MHIYIFRHIDRVNHSALGFNGIYRIMDLSKLFYLLCYLLKSSVSILGLSWSPHHFLGQYVHARIQKKNSWGGGGGGSKGYQCLNGVGGMAPRLTFGNFTM